MPFGFTLLAQLLEFFGGNASWTIMKFINIFIFPGLVFLAGMIFLAILGTFIDHFVVTIMAIENCRFKTAWQKFVAIFKQNTGEFFLYILLLIGLGILCGIIAIFVAIACIVVILIVGAILFGLPYLLIGILLKANIIYIIFAVILGIPFLIAACLLLVSVGLPFAVFFRSLSLYFLSSLRCGYEPLSLNET